MPEWNMSAGAQYSFKVPIPRGAATVTPRLDWVYQSKSTFDPASAVEAPAPQYTIGGRSVLNAQVTVSKVDSPWSVIGSVTNLTNKYYLYELFTGSTVATAGVVAPPREFNVTVRRQF
jgi:outer membrane receptor protein involved in Fe transport